MIALLASPATLCAAVALFLVAAFVVPVVRHRLKTGSSGITLHRDDPVQRVVGVAFGSQIIAVAGFLGALWAMPPSSLGVISPPPAFVVLGWATLSAGLVAVVVAQVTMGTSWRIGIDQSPTALVTRGLFSFVRNPIFSGMVLMLAGVTLVAPSLFMALLTVEAACVVAVQARLEEAHLARLHGDVYRAYAGRVGRFLPGIGRLSARAS
jgi:protein-S-isoprenylcysteine O-methyltransferase Ste14